MQLTIAIAALLVSLIVALFVYKKSPRSGTHVYFSALVFFISIYPVFNYLAVHSVDDQTALLWAKMILFVSIPQGPLLYFFASTFPNNTFKFNVKRQIIIAAWASLNLLLASAGLIFESVAVTDGVVSIQPGPLVPSFGLLHVSTIVGGLYILHKKYKKSKGLEHKQLSFIYYGILISFTLTFLITLILPLVLKNTVLLAISPVFLTVSVIAVAYAIVAQKLFDIRAAAARSVAYILLIGTLALIYSVGLFGIINILFKGENRETLRQISSMLLVAPLALGFQQFREFFNRVTDRLFYRDVYNTQAVLDEIGQLLVAEIRLQKIISKTRIILLDALKCSFVELILFRDGQPFVESQEKQVTANASGLSILCDALSGQKNDSIVTDELAQDDHVKKLLNDNKIAISIHLTTQGQTVGYIMVGHKRSGDPYSSKDFITLDFVAKELAVGIQNALRFEEIEQFNFTLQKKVSDATKELRKTNEKLKALDEAKDEFISMASHQLRTPLTSVKGYLSMLSEGDAGKLNEVQRRFIDQAFVSSQRMVYLISDLLNVSRLKTGKFVIEPTPVYLPDVVESEIAQLYETVKSRGLTMTYDKPKRFPTLNLDETKLRQVIMNFTDNAIYYTPSGGTILLDLKEVSGGVEFTVNDNGLGVPRQEQHNLFTKFYRAGNARKARPDGTGLGLFMAKKVIVASGGSLIFKSQEGKGSTFGFRFNIPKA